MKETAALILTHRRTKKVLLQHRSDDAPTFPGHFSPFGGALDPGESPEEAAKREAFEELGIWFADFRYVDYFDTVEGGVLKKRAHLFVGPVDSDEEQLLLSLREGKGLGFFTFQETAGVRIAREDRALLAIARWHLEAR